MNACCRIAVVCLGLGLPQLAAGATYTVTSSADSGAGTLRWAITAANTNPGADTIAFNLPAPYRIQPTTPLPACSGSDPVTMDGATQPEFAGTPLVTLEGSLAGAASGLMFSDLTSAVVRALNVSKWSQNGIVLRRGLSNRVENCRISTNANIGVYMETCRYCIIGGAGPLLRNVIVSNSVAGIQISGDHNLVLGNLVGTDGTSARPNDYGVQVWSGQSNRIGGAVVGEGNVLSGNRSYGLYLLQWSSNTTVIGNYIGTDESGAAAVRNSVGVVIEGARNTIGGLVAAERNLISGNTWGLRLIGNYAYDNVLRGNWIGLGASGAAVSNTQEGVQIMQGAATNLIGGPGAAHRNVISGNGTHGVAVTDAGSRANRIQGNHIGLGADGVTRIGNGQHGVRVSAPDTVVGGGPGEGNTIAGNGTDGVSVSGANAIGNRIEGNIVAHNSGCGIWVWDNGAVSNLLSANSLYLNVGVGIGLGSASPTPNDHQDPDTGPNQLQNYPVLTLVSNAGATLAVGGYLNSTPSTQFTVEFFGSSTCDATGHGEGEVFLGTQTVMTDLAGMAGFTNSSLPAPTPPPSFVTATARHTLRRETSEFSRYLMLDSDGDGMPDGWEFANFGSATGGDPAGHSDTDTIPNLEEFIADTDPLDEADYPRFTGMAPDDGDIRIDVQTAATRVYRLEDVPRAGLDGWGSRFPAKLGTGSPVSWHWGYADSNAVFRCRVLLP